MDQAWIHKFYHVVTPYAVVLLAILFSALVSARCRYAKKNGYPPLAKKLITILDSSKRALIVRRQHIISTLARKLSLLQRKSSRNSTVGSISNPALKKFLVANFSAVELLIHSLTTLLFFICGLGRFRTIVFLSAFFCLKGVFSFRRIDDRILTMSFVPLIVIFAWNDVMKGQIFPVFSRINPLFFIAVFFIFIYIDALVTRRLRKEVTLLSGRHFFSVCPRCQYDNSALVETCMNCHYQQGAPSSVAVASPLLLSLPARDILVEREYYKERALGDDLPSKALLFTELDGDEFVLIVFRWHHGNSFFVNDSRELLKYAILSTKKITLLHYLSSSEGWRFRQIIPYTQIIGLSAHRKPHGLAEMLALSISTVENKYEMMFHPTEKNLNKIIDVVACIEKRASGCDATIAFKKPDDWRSDLSGVLDTDVKDYFKSPWEK